MHLIQAWLGLLAGGTIVLGLPIARVRAVSTKTKAFLNAISTGILIFLLVEITGHVLEQIEELIVRAAAGQPGLEAAIQYGGLFAVGFSLGLLGLVYFERRWLGAAKDTPSPRRAKQVAAMIAIGLGLHNFSEGLAIGQGYASGAFQLAWLLAIGFALHNATEGFGIAAPLSGQAVSWGYLGWMGLIAGGPTFVGAVIAGWWNNKPTEIFCLALASGTILYVVGELLHLGRQLKEESVVEIGLLIGFFVAVITDFALVGAMHHRSAMEPSSMQRDAPHEESQEALHRPRHGGYFGDADDLYHYEVLLNGPRQLILYVNDDLNRPLDVRTLRGEWRLNPDEPAEIRGTFRPTNDGAYFIAALPATAVNPLHVEVAVLKGHVWARMEFYIPAVPKHVSVVPAHRFPRRV